jgi:Ca2+-transporting ATPase
VLCLGFLAAAVWLPGLSDVLGLPDPGVEGLILAGAMSALPLALGQVLLLAMGPDWLMPHGQPGDANGRGAQDHAETG